MDLYAIWHDHKAVIITAVICLAVGGGLGWSMKPNVVSVQEKVVEKEVAVKDERIDQLLTQISQMNKDYQEMKNSELNVKTHTVVVENTNVDGSKTKTTTSDKSLDQKTTETKHEVEVKVVTVEKQVVVTQTETVVKEVEKEKIVTAAKPDWKLGLMVGAAPQVPNVVDTAILVGVEADRRIVGPVFLGAWVMGGSPVVGGFRVTNVAVGLKVGVEF